MSVSKYPIDSSSPGTSRIRVRDEGGRISVLTVPVSNVVLDFTFPWTT